MVTTAGKAVGTAATARLMAIKAKAIKVWPEIVPCPMNSLVKYAKKTTKQMDKIAYPSLRPKTSSRLCRGVISSLASLMSEVILPIWVCMPVEMATARVLPVTTAVEAKSILVCEPICTSAFMGASIFSTGTLSPVSADSSTLRCTALIILPSAGTLSPASR